MRTLSGVLFSACALILAVSCGGDSQSIATPTFTETQEISVTPPRESPTPIEGVVPTETRIAVTLIIVMVTPTPTATPSREDPSLSLQSEFTGLSEEALEEAREEILDTEKGFPIADILPYGGPFHGEPFAIHNPGIDGTILIEIDAAVNFEEAKSQALGWISSQDFNPDDYNIHFRVRPFSK